MTMKTLFTAAVVVCTLLTLSVQANDDVEQLTKQMMSEKMEQVNLTLAKQVSEDIHYATFLLTAPVIGEPVTLMANHEAKMNKATDSE